MRQSIQWPAVLCAIVFCSAATVKADDANPRYAAWAKFAVGASATTKSDITTPEKSITQTLVTKLTAITPEKATLELTLAMNNATGSITMPVHSEDVPAKGEPGTTPFHDLFSNGLANLANEEAASKDAKTGTEDIKIGDITVHTTWTEFSFVKEGSTVHAKTWRNESVPGGVVKMTAEMTGKRTATVNTIITAYSLGG